MSILANTFVPFHICHVIDVSTTSRGLKTCSRPYDSIPTLLHKKANANFRLSTTSHLNQYFATKQSSEISILLLDEHVWQAAGHSVLLHEGVHIDRVTAVSVLLAQCSSFRAQSADRGTSFIFLRPPTVLSVKHLEQL